MARNKKGTTENLAIMAGIILAGLIAIVYVSKYILQEGVLTEDIMISSAKDISTYATTLSVFDAGMQIYTLPREMQVKVEGNSVQLSSGSIKVSSEFSGNVKETSFTAKKVCIVENTIAGEEQTFICDAGNFECCKPRIE